MKMTRLITAGLMLTVGSRHLVRGDSSPIPSGHRTRDVAFAYRMGAGFAGDVNRVHPVSIEPALQSPDTPLTFYGQPCLPDPTNNAVRAVGVADQALTDVYGVLVRPYPTQQSSGGMTSNFGAATPPDEGILDILRSGYIMVPVVGTPAKGGAVYIWTAASSGLHVQGGWEAADPAGSGMALPRYVCSWNGPPDASGIAELEFHV